MQLGSEQVPVISCGIRLTAVVEPVQSLRGLEHLPSADWLCAWGRFAQYLDPECQSIVGFTFRRHLFGLMKLGLYESDGFRFVEIENLECKPRTKEEVAPVGKWLIWYACKLAISSNAVVTLTSLDQAVSYYEETIGMNKGNAVAIAPGEDGYLFSFTQQQAKTFCQTLER